MGARLITLSILVILGLTVRTYEQRSAGKKMPPPPRPAFQGTQVHRNYRDRLGTYLWLPVSDL